MAGGGGRRDKDGIRPRYWLGGRGRQPIGIVRFQLGLCTCLFYEGLFAKGHQTPRTNGLFFSSSSSSFSSFSFSFDFLSSLSFLFGFSSSSSSISPPFCVCVCVCCYWFRMLSDSFFFLSDSHASSVALIGVRMLGILGVGFSAAIFRVEKGSDDRGRWRR